MAIQVNGVTGLITGANNLSLVAGTATVAPLNLTAGTNLTSATTGAIEYDGTNFYTTPLSLQRGVQLSEQYAVLSANYTLTSQTGAQKLFNVITNGAITLQPGAYEFECNFALTGLSATSGTFGFAFAGTATYTQGWTATAAVQATSLATATNQQISFNSAANTALATAGTGTFGSSSISGILRVTVAGTIIPSVSLSVASAAIVQTNSFFRIRSIGAAAVTSQGNWS
jgi:hypothetical protein